MKKKWILAGGLLMTATATGISFAQTATSQANVTVTQNTFATVSAVNGSVLGNYSHAPSWGPISQSVGKTGSGDLYVITPPASGMSGNVLATLYLSNPDVIAKATMPGGALATVTPLSGTYTFVQGTALKILTTMEATHTAADLSDTTALDFVSRYIRLHIESEPKPVHIKVSE